MLFGFKTVYINNTKSILYVDLFVCCCFVCKLWMSDTIHPFALFVTTHEMWHEMHELQPKHQAGVTLHQYWRICIKNRVQFKILMHMYKALHEQAPRYISDMLTVYQPRRTLWLMGSVTLVVPKVRTSSYGERIFHCSAARLWDGLPAHTRESKTLNIFKMHLFSRCLDV